MFREFHAGRLSRPWGIVVFMAAPFLGGWTTVTPIPSPIPSGTHLNTNAYDEEVRGYLAPGLQFGGQSQEVSASLGWGNVARSDAGENHHKIGGEWHAYGLRVGCEFHDFEPAAAQGLFYLSAGGWSWEWWPFGIEFALGGGGNGYRGYGVAQLSYIMGIASRLEIAFTGQWVMGSNIEPPGWFSTHGTVGVRYGFDLGKSLARTTKTQLVND